MVRWARLLLACLALGAFAGAQLPVEAWPRPPEQAVAGEALWVHPEGRERVWRTVVSLFERHYWDAGHRDWAAWGASFRDDVVAAQDRAAFDGALRRMVRSIADDHSAWLGLPSQAPSASAPAPPPRLGVQLGYVEGRGLVVERVYPGTPAAEADLRRADVITAVGDRDLRLIGGLAEASALLAAALRGPGATLRVERGRTAREVAVVGAAVPFAEVAGRPYGVLLADAVGYLHVPSFQDDGVGASAHAVLRDLVDQGARSLVLDLRGNLGGRLVEAGLLMGAFVDGPWARASARGAVAWVASYATDAGPAGPRGVSRLVGVDGDLVAEARVADPVRFTGPVVVVVGRESSSAGEIVPAALLDLGRARVVGERTPGNVEAVRAYALPDGSRVWIAVALVEGARGSAFDGGVVPEVIARAALTDLAAGADPPVDEARRLLGGLPFTPGRWIR